LDRLQERIRSRGGVVLGVSIDDDCGQYEHFLKERRVAFQTTCEPANKEVLKDYGSSMIPETYVIDRQGRIARKIVGAQQWDSAEMTEYFDTTLARN
jgi:cytochrome c biogenesis protein CcmG, thiol:disulfide interchange protein DsbE